MNGVELVELDREDEVAWMLQREMHECPVVVRLRIDGDPKSKARARVVKGGAYTPRETLIEEHRVGMLVRAKLHRLPDAEKTYGVLAIFFTANGQRRDVDNMIKLVLDGCTGVVWKDDSQVSEVSGRLVRATSDGFPRTHLLIYETLAYTPPTKPCEVCGAEVRQYASQPNRYCSRVCAGRGSRNRVTLTCMECQSSFELARHRAATLKTPLCSPECRRRHLRVDAPCVVCGTAVSRPRSQAKVRLTCSVECATRRRIERLA